MSDPITQMKDWLFSLPTFTRTYLISSIILSLVSSLRLVDYHWFAYFPQFTFFNFQLWRLITCALFFNRLSFGLVFSLYFSYYFMRKAEDVIFPGHKAQFVMLMTWFWVVLLLMATLFGIPFISEAMTMTLLTFWCKSRPHENISLFFGLDMESGYFPFVFVGFSVLMGQPLIVLILGVITGYSYIFIAEFLKTHYGIQMLRPPAFLLRLVKQEPTKIKQPLKTGVRVGSS